MGIMDLFGSPFIFSLIIIIVLLGVLYSYFNYKLSEQDHKISSMFGLVKSMADEMQFIRRMKGNNLGETINLEYATQLLPEEDVNEELISVSDTEKYDDENLDVDDDSEIEEDSDFEEDEDLDIDELGEDTKTIHLEEPIDLNTDFEPLDLNFTQIEESKEQEELKEQEDLDIDVVDPNKINLTKSDNYKKMSLNKLREVIVEKGLVADASKFKKNDILKLLGEE
jgi:hypothetical protein